MCQNQADKIPHLLSKKPRPDVKSQLRIRFRGVEKILTFKVDHRTARVKIFIIAVDPKHRYSNEAERAD